VNTRPDFSEFKVVFDRAVDHIGTVVRGKRDVVCKAFVCLFARGHLLIEDVPGVAKTSLAKAVAKAIGGTVGRVQFTPDLLPSDLLGVDVFNQRSLEFEFREGPIFANVMLGDEINRASPKTQSALLEAMAEGQVTVGRTRHGTPQPFLCIATQNPIEQYGTFPLPKALTRSRRPGSAWRRSLRWFMGATATCRAVGISGLGGQAPRRAAST
jgi:MoxR-like ATPase